MINIATPKEQREAPDYYDQFVDKFKPKKTPDDCYTPENIYNIVRDWAVAEYGLGENTRIIRPFWPGGDYQSEDYSGDCVVIDNPPFSILSSICNWYNDHGVRFFLFAPSLTLFSVCHGRFNYVSSDARIVYENGAKVNTSFVTNMGNAKIHCAPDLNRAIKQANYNNLRAAPKKLSRKAYRDNVCTNMRAGYISKNGIELRINAEDVYFVRALDAQNTDKLKIYGDGFLLSQEAAAAFRAAMEAAREKDTTKDNGTWELSAREYEIVKKLGKGDNKQ